MATEILIGWVISGAVIGAIVTPILYMSKQRNALPGVFVGAVAGAVGNLILLVPLWLSIARAGQTARHAPADPVLREAALAADPLQTDSTPLASAPRSPATEAAYVIVEDDPSIFDTMLAMCEIWNVDPIAFTDGSDAIKWIEDMENDVTVVSIPELALLDMRLPGATGPEIGQRLRESPLLGNIAIVLMTAYQLSVQQERDAVAQSQADRLIYKPLPSPAELHKLLRDVIARRQGESVY